jgi:formylglycine-generating enzyme required for sulfatase activity
MPQPLPLRLIGLVTISAAVEALAAAAKDAAEETASAATGRPGGAAGLGTTVALAPWLGPMAPLVGAATSFGVNLLSEAWIRRRDARKAAGELLANEHVARVQATVIAARLRQMQADAPFWRSKESRSSIGQLADDTLKWWCKAVQDPARLEVAAARGSSVSASMAAHLHPIGTPNAPAAPRITEADWIQILKKAKAEIDPAGRVFPTDLRKVAAALDHHFVADTIEGLKADLATDGRAYAAITFQFLAQITVQVDRLTREMVGMGALQGEIKSAVERLPAALAAVQDTLSALTPVLAELPEAVRLTLQPDLASLRSDIHQIPAQVSAELKPQFDRFVELQQQSLALLRDQGSDAPRRAHPAGGPARTVEDYKAGTLEKVGRLLIDRFSLGDSTQRPQVDERSLQELYVELPVAADRTGRGSELTRNERAFFAGVGRALIHGSLGVGTRDLLWIPVPFAHYDLFVGHFAIEGVARNLDARTVTLGQLESFEDPMRLFCNGPGKRGECPDLISIFLPDPMEAWSEAWSNARQALRSLLPDSRVVGVVSASSIPLELLLLLDPTIHGLPGRYVVRGDPGTGKSTALRGVAWRALTGLLDERVPVLVDLPRLVQDEYRGASLRDLLCGMPELASIENDLQSFGASLLLLFDGLDEVRDPAAREWVEQQLATAAGPQGWPQARIVVATRSIGYVPFAPRSYQDVEILPLDEDRQRRLLVNWYASRTPRTDRATRPEDFANRVLTEIHAGSRGFQDLCKVPLLLSFVAMLHEDGAETEIGSQPTWGRSQVYVLILDRLLQGRHRKRFAADRASYAVEPLAAARLALRLLAFQGTLDDGTGTSVATREYWEQRLADLRSVAELRPLWQRWTAQRDETAERRFLGHVAERSGILGGPDDLLAPWSFWHRSLREALVAEHLAALVGKPAGKAQVLALARQVRGQEGLWAEPFSLFVGMLEAKMAQEWLILLGKQNQDLALRALAGLERVDEGTLNALLGGADGDRERLFQQYGRLYELVGQDVAACARLIGSIASGVGDCEALWHLDQALDELERQHPREGQLIRAARARFFEHESFGRRPNSGEIEALAPSNIRPYWILVPEGTEFPLGSPPGEAGRFDDEGPVQQVRIARAFELAAAPITRRQWAKFRRPDAPDSPDTPHGHADLPVTNVSWFSAAMFCRWMGTRLPSEAEWECACRAGTTTAYWFGDDARELSRHAWYSDNSDGRPNPVGEKPANPWSLGDMHGNVLEWCQDKWHESYRDAPLDGSAWESRKGTDHRVARGGSWAGGAWWCRSAYRFNGPPGGRSAALGLRPARFTR